MKVANYLIVLFVMISTLSFSQLTLIKDINPDSIFTYDSRSNYFDTLNGLVYFAASGNQSNVEI